MGRGMGIEGWGWFYGGVWVWRLVGGFIWDFEAWFEGGGGFNCKSGLYIKIPDFYKSDIKTPDDISSVTPR